MQTLGAIFWSQTTLGAIFTRIFRAFAQIFSKSKLLGVVLATEMARAVARMAKPLAKINFDVIYLITPFILIYKLWVLFDLAKATLLTRLP